MPKAVLPCGPWHCWPLGAGFVIRLVKRRQEREQTNDSSAQAAGADPNETEVQ